MITTDEQIIEAMARAMQRYSLAGHWRQHADGMRAALAAARPLIERETIERCAKVAEGAKLMSYGPHQHPEKIAAAIRALADEKDDG